jgi:hypothetical protein
MYFNNEISSCPKITRASALGTKMKQCLKKKKHNNGRLCQGIANSTLTQQVYEQVRQINVTNVLLA